MVQASHRAMGVRLRLFSTLRGVRGGDLARDLAAGLTLLAIAAPEQMATARLGGVPPQIGFLVFVAATCGFIMLGANRRMSVGADSTITPILAGSLAAIATAGSTEYASLLAILALMVGVLLSLGGALKLGWVADLLSRPVLTGFLAGISVHVALSQAPALLGLPEGHGSTFARVSQLFSGIGCANPWSAVLGLFVFASVLIAEKLNPKIPAALIAVILATVAVIGLQLEAKGVKVLGVLGSATPTFHWPMISLNQGLRVSGLAFVVAMVVMMQTAATSRSFAGAGEPVHINQDFLGVGLGNLFAGLIGAFPVNASPPRTALALAAGATSQAAGLVAALALLGLAIAGGGLFAHVPTAALAGVLLIVAQRIFRLEEFKRVFATARGEFALAVATLFLIVLLPIQTGVAVGMFLSLVHGVYLTTRADPTEFLRVRGTTIWWPADLNLEAEAVDGVLVLGFAAPLSFLNAFEFRSGVVRAVKGRPGLRLMVLEASSIADIDYTASEILKETLAAIRQSGVEIALARLESPRAQEAFRRFGLLDALGEGGVFLSVEAAVSAFASVTPAPSPTV